MDLRSANSKSKVKKRVVPTSTSAPATTTSAVHFTYPMGLVAFRYSSYHMIVQSMNMASLSIVTRSLAWA